jgi:hypothetical protein
MLSPTKVLSKYMPLMTKMVRSFGKVTLVQTNFELICDISILIGLACLLPMCEIAHFLIMFSYNKEKFLFMIMLKPLRFTKVNYTWLLQQPKLMFCFKCLI